MHDEDRLPSATAAPLPGPPLVRQSWRDTTFVHWPVAPADVAPLLPPGTRPDTLGGVSHVGLVAFRVTATTVAGVLPTGGFTEVNVRLYAVDGAGRRGVVFVTMDADSLHSVLAARALTGLPYIWSDTSLRPQEGGIAAGAVRRRWPGGHARGRWRIAVRDHLAEPSPLERFLTARWGLHTAHAGRTWWIGISHRPWRLFRADLLAYEGNLVDAAGIPLGEQPPISVLWSPGVDTDVCPSPAPVA
ncbi:YqjF family protein [Allosalinactinospora lopnorensis]|uniref:YqjF family protein n=1 Tax=Allosalinactinospora lopnorensis TaxID=1352348 RepID=UPI001F170652|nr:DUF2071 domain-containing protein [Allosalinactinospora lopnorensis]